MSPDQIKLVRPIVGAEQEAPPFLSAFFVFDDWQA
jgi:hypothetical protein